MIGRYNQQEAKTRDAVWEEAKTQAENNNQHPIAEDFIETVLSGIEESRIEIHQDMVPVDGGKYDETYYTHEAHELIGHTDEKVWFNTQTTRTVVEDELTEILEEMNLNLGIVDSSLLHNDVVKYSITVPFITEDERQQNIREETVELARDMREYIPIVEDAILGECPRDGCDGKRYQDGMGSVGPKYVCNRLACGYKGVRDVR